MWGKSRKPAAFKRIAKSDSGASAVEFALVAAPFFFVLGCIMETGVLLFSEYVLQNSVQDAARMVRTGQVSTTNGTPLMTEGDFKDEICEQANIIFDCDTKVTVYVNSAADFATLSTDMADPLVVGKKLDGTSDPVTFTPGAALEAATVIATYDWQFIMPFMDFLGNINGGSERRIYGLAIFRNEPF